VSEWPGSTAAAGDQTRPLQVNVLPELSTATQKVAPVQETPVNEDVLKIDELDSICCGPVQLWPLYIRPCPVASTAAQNEVVGHETWVRPDDVPKT